MRTKKIAFNLLCYNSSNLAGTWNFFKRLIEKLPPLPEVEFLFLVQTGFELERELKVPKGIRHTIISSRSCRSRLGRIAYEQFVLPFQALKADLLFTPCVAGPILHTKAIVVSTIHDLTPFFVRRKYGPLQGLYVRCITKLLALTSDKIVTSSENSRKDLITELNVDYTKISVVHAFVEARSDLRIEYEKFFLFVGTLQPGKNLESVIRAFAIFRDRYDTENHHLVIVGASGWGTHTKYKDLVHELGMTPHVRFVGFISDEELDQLYAKCKGLILLSLYEGFGMPPLEALSWNKPSIVSNCSSLPEVVGKTGILVDPLDTEMAARAIKCLADSPTSYLGGIEEQFSKFSPSSQIERFLEVLNIS